MPICKECNCNFPPRKWVDGKSLDLRRRTYCLECSPFGERKRCGVRPKKSDEPRFCIQCGKIHTAKKNLVCTTCRGFKRRRENKNRCLEIKGNKCKKCGYNKCKKALCFHHKDPKEKSFTISAFWHISWEKIQKELEKCDLLCLNCHAEEHAKELEGLEED